MTSLHSTALRLTTIHKTEKYAKKHKNTKTQKVTVMQAK